ncbi:MAG: hypothetical protein KAJ17_01380 [Candidatus Krumholzibacteria bacterium]|nr:hypothetical protein [Candidatus Krumholzibacteria bacterium]
MSVARFIRVSSILCVFIAAGAAAEPITLRSVVRTPAPATFGERQTCAVASGLWEGDPVLPPGFHTLMRLWVASDGLGVDSVYIEIGWPSPENPDCTWFTVSSKFTPAQPISGTTPPDCMMSASVACFPSTSAGWQLTVDFLSATEAKADLIYFPVSAACDETCPGFGVAMPVEAMSWGALKMLYD